MDSYQVQNDFKDGYNVYPDLDKENMEKLKQIASIIIPNKEYQIDNEEYRIELSGKLLDLFEREMDYILGEYHSEKENEMMTTAKETISKEMGDYLEDPRRHFRLMDSLRTDMDWPDYIKEKNW